MHLNCCKLTHASLCPLTHFPSPPPQNLRLGSIARSKMVKVPPNFYCPKNTGHLYFHLGLCEWLLSGVIDENQFYWNRTNAEELDSNSLTGPTSDHLGVEQGRLNFCVWNVTQKQKFLRKGYFLYTNPKFGTKEGAIAAFNSPMTTIAKRCVKFQYWFHVRNDNWFWKFVILNWYFLS